MNELCHLWRSERYGACGDDVSDGVLFTGEKYPKAAGDTGAEGPVRAKRPRFPGPLSETIWGPRTSPAKRVVWGEDEQRSERGLPLAAG